ncbi:MAG: spermine/spermidine synthase domain-containing protein [Candidatus Limnocylindrales bacterium]
MTAARRPLPSLAPVPFLRDPRVRLVLTSATLLFTELLLIRWIPSTVKYVGFFTNFLLMASFLGIGLGILLGRSGRRLAISPFAGLLFLAALLVLVAHLDVQVKSTDEIFFGLAESTSADTNFVVLPLLIVLVTAVMAALALPLGPLLKSQPPLRAYGLDICGSMAGIAGFAVLSALWTPPLVWFSVVAVLLLLLGLGSGLGPWSPISGIAMLSVLYLAVLQQGWGATWSPYYRVNVYPVPGALELTVDGIPHQAIWSGAPQDDLYYQVYKWFPGRTYNEVLVVGAGSGNDVAVALSHGAGHVDAVEIDPAIQQIGVTDHPLHPYDDPRVTRYTNDGRAFLRSTDKHYDLVIFALPDSLTLVSSSGNIRLESFLFTVEAFQSVRDHLTPDGTFVLYNYYREPWLVAKLDSMVQTAFGTPPILRTFEGVHAALADGPAVTALNGGPPPGDSTEPLPSVGAPTPQQATDDWPFLYLRTPTIQPHYLFALGFVLLFALLSVAGAAAVTRTPLRGFSPHFFVLGTAFMLLETRSLVSFSLLFGTTWLVNALAFFAILASVLVAILVNSRLKVRRSRPLYALLFAALAVAFLLPPEQLLLDPPWLRYLLASIVAFAPVFLANMVFTFSFRDTKIADMAFASNLIGAMLGGVIEYVALLTGYRLLLIVVAALYLGAWLFASRFRILADVGLTLDSST